MARVGVHDLPAVTAGATPRLLAPLAAVAWRPALLGFLVTLVVGVLLLGGLSAGIAVAAGDTVLRGVTVAGVDVAGLGRTAAAERLSRELPSLSTGQAVVSVAGAEEAVSYSDLGRDYDMQAMVDAAIAVGRGDGNPMLDGVERLRTLAHTSALPAIVHPYDPDALASIADEIATSLRTPPRDAAVLRDGSAFRVRPAELGKAVEAGAVADALAAAIHNADPSDVRIELTPADLAPRIATAAAEAAASDAEAMAADLRLTISNPAGEDPLALTAETIAVWITFGPDGEVEYTARLDTAALAAHVEGLAAAINRDAVNAQIGVAAGGGLGGVIPAQDGRALNVQESVTRVLDALKRRAAGVPLSSVALAVDVTEPPVTTAEARAQLPQMQMISSWTTYFVPGESNGYGANIVIGAFDIDGRNLAPGEWFSFWNSIGPVTTARGYTYGGAILNGRTTQGVAIGGGICSTSTTIFNAALRAGLEMGVRANHSYYIDRYPDGLDATVLITDAFTQDMTFRNDTDNVIVVRGFGNKSGSVTFQLWSIPTGRRVVITDPVTSNHGRAIDTTVVDPSMAPGTSKRVEFPHHGHDVTRSRYVYAANGDLLHQDTYFSRYRTVNGILLVGPPAAAVPAPTPPPDGGTTAVGDEPAPPETPPNG